MSELIALEPRPTPPDLPGTVVVRPAVEDLTETLGVDLLLHAKNCVRSFGDFHLALSGGSTPIPLYRRLMIDPRFRDFPWKRTHLWLVDERRVPFDDARSNCKTISEIIGDHSGIPPTQFHPIYALADDADRKYDALIREVLAWREPGHDRLDYILLGMGADGHTASLFPHSPALDDPHAPLRDDAPFVKINAGPTVTPPDRVTMTYRIINGARFIAVMITGDAKRDRLAQVASRRGTHEQMPILGVQPVGGDLRWYLDEAACPEDPAPGGVNGDA